MYLPENVVARALAIITSLLLSVEVMAQESSKVPLEIYSGVMRAAITEISREDNLGQTCITMEINYEDQRELTGICFLGLKTDTEVEELVREKFFYEAGYLFVEELCGGGNNWRCDTLKVFSIVDRKLVNIGQTISMKRGQREKFLAEIGPSDGRYRFFDIYNELEINALTSHAESPYIYAALIYDHGKLVIDREATWKINEQIYNEYGKVIASAISSGSGSLNPDALESLKSKLLFRSALAKFCGKQNELVCSINEAYKLLESVTFGVFMETVDATKNVIIY